jgi:hypothetical protein
MSEEETARSKDIKGVKIEHIEWLIDIIRTKYRIVKRGTKYLETAERKFDLTALANIRDFLSHIETAFNEDVPEKERSESILQSEEHLRRALVESHQIALESRLEKFLEEYAQYEKDLLPNEARYGIDHITNHGSIRENIRKIQEYYNEGRKRKGTNIWNKEWEMGVEFFVNGYELAVKLQDEIKHYKEKYHSNKYAYEKSESSRKLTIKLAIWGIIITTIITIIIASVFSIPGIKLLEWLFNVKLSS